MLKPFLNSSIFLCIAIFVTTAQASIYDKTTCNNANVYEDIDCLGQENKQFINDLNIIYNTIKTTKVSVDEASVPSSEYLKSFNESQTAWNKFTTANCQMLNLPYASLQGGGIGLVNGACWNNAYRSRVNELNSWMAELQEK